MYNSDTFLLIKLLPGTDELHFKHISINNCKYFVNILVQELSLQITVEFWGQDDGGRGVSHHGEFGPLLCEWSSGGQKCKIDGSYHLERVKR